MSYKISFKSSVERDLKRIDKKSAKKILDKIEKELPKSTVKHPSLTGKFSGLKKYRIGDYRIIYTILDDTILILRIAHRKEAYK